MNPKFEKRLRSATVLVSAGLATQAATMFSDHPLAFLAFILIASPITAIGVLVYLVALIRD